MTSNGDLHIKSAQPSDGAVSYSCLTLHSLTGERRRSAPASLMVTGQYYQLTNWLLRNPEVHYRPYISSPLGPIISKIYPDSRITTCLPQIHFNIILPSTPWHPYGLFPSGFPTITLYAFLDCSIHATCPAHLCRLDLRLLITLGEE